MVVRKKSEKIAAALVQWGGFLLVTMIILAPFAWLFISSVASQADLLSKPLKFWPEHIDFSRYVRVFSGNTADETAYTFYRAMFNSFKVALVVTVISLVAGTMAAYAFTRMQGKFKDKLLYLFIYTYMLPPIAIIIPMFLIMSKLGLLDTIYSLIIVYSSFITPFVVWLMRGFLATLPVELEEAAMVDGLSRLQAFIKVILPLAVPGLVATGIFAFLMAWDEFMYALIFTSSLDAKTISVAIAEFSGKNAVDYGMIATGGVLAALPPVLLALIFQKYIISGLTSGSVKG
ncbi:MULTISPECIES: carbohydrate ABC transporter permease [Carboxydothermus]|uniref:ABC transmembrane type-1 domain-containing protein n=2 Tax=Carboxydothermus TaxID=129957 RepID=A0A1L8CWM8_9THEO|nr:MULTISPECIES: carbohydrate ABC transporter permease [Carboxydothermus]NYE57781.1 multiple sugar transport system permease protein [Carboxydothermus ferrireducens DSM 11255]GAV23320.1 hypothetical protein cpu_18300 [Carboxydothermus pertinax]